MVVIRLKPFWIAWLMRWQIMVVLALDKVSSFLSPEHVGIVSGAGWSKVAVQEYLFEKANRPVDGMRQVGKFVDGEYRKQGRAEMHRGLEPADILVTVGGGDAGGHSALYHHGADLEARSCRTSPSVLYRLLIGDIRVETCKSHS